MPANAGAIAVLGGRAFGSYWRLTLADGADRDAARRAIERVASRVDALLSPYRVGSELSRFNRATESMRLSPETALVTKVALAVADQTGGAFDPTVGPIVARYGFGPISGDASGSYRALTLDGATLHKARPGLTLDLCGIAKGHALDCMAEALATDGIDNLLLDLGGEVVARGKHPEGRGWRVAVEGRGGEMIAVAALEGFAVATSGDIAQGYRLGGSGYGHIVDPKTNRPADRNLASVSVFHFSAMRADALATALFAKGREVAQGFADALGIDAILVPREGAPILTGAVARHLEAVFW